MKNVKLSFLVLFLVGSIYSVYAQDIILLKNGNEIQAKVLEITQAEIKYKRYDNIDGPTISINKTEVQLINYENGAQDIITVSSNSSTEITSKRHNSKNFYTEIYINPLGFLQFGPLAGLEFTIGKHFIIDPFVQIPSLGLLTNLLFGGSQCTNYSGFGFGGGLKYFTGGQKGGFYVGPTLLFWTLHYNNEKDARCTAKQLVIAANLGYKFQFASGFYMRTGGFLGMNKILSFVWTDGHPASYDDNTIFGMLEVSLGYTF